jgi:hypothetical protein
MIVTEHQYLLGVIAGLDPAIHHLAKRMDARIEPAHDRGRAMQ